MFSEINKVSGRYTVTFLKPNRWYGIDYLVERGKEKFREQRIVKTLSLKASDHTDNEDIFGVSLFRKFCNIMLWAKCYSTRLWILRKYVFPKIWKNRDFSWIFRNCPIGNNKLKRSLEKYSTIIRIFRWISTAIRVVHKILKEST